MPELTVTALVFYAFAALALLAVGYILLTRNLVRAAFALFFAFIAQAALYVFAGAEVLAVGQIIVYVGGVLILLLFGVMLTQRSLPAAVARVPSMPRTGLRTVVAGLLGATALVALVVVAFPPEVFAAALPAEPTPVGPSGDSLRRIGVLSLTDYLLAFELLSVLLLVALVAAASLARLRTTLPADIPTDR